MTTRYSVLVSRRRTHLCELETYERGQLEVSRWLLAKGRWSASCGPRFCMGSGALSKQFGIKFTFSYFEITVCTLHTCIVDECTKLLAGAPHAHRSLCTEGRLQLTCTQMIEIERYPEYYGRLRKLSCQVGQIGIGFYKRSRV